MTRVQEALTFPMDVWDAMLETNMTSVFLASHASDYVHGVIIPVDGGFAAR